MPLDSLLRLLSNLASIAILGGGSYLLYQWYEGELISDRWLFLGVGLLLWSFFGFLPISVDRKVSASTAIARLKSTELVSTFVLYQP
ncbi:MAG TPA: hypothetical protein V6C95_15510 [Coleofasciculaceae cyanobacterium]